MCQVDRHYKMSVICSCVFLVCLLNVCCGKEMKRLLLNDPMHLESEIQQLKVSLNAMTAKVNDLTTNSKNEVDSLKATISSLKTQMSTMQNVQGNN